MRKIQIVEIPATMPLIRAVFVFVWIAAFSNSMYGLEIRPVNVTPENLKDYPIIENIIVEDTGLTVVTVVVTFTDEDAAEELHRSFRFRAIEGYRVLAVGGLSVSSYSLISDYQVLVFFLDPDLLDDSYLWYSDSSEHRSIVFRLSEWIDREENKSSINGDQDEGNEGGESGPAPEEATSDPGSG